MVSIYPNFTLDCLLAAMSPFSFWLYVGFASSLLIQINLATACLQDERNSLLDFKAGLTDYSGRLSSWQGDNCCQWRGVHCDSRSSHVIRLDLKNKDRFSDGELSGLKNLSGPIHPSLFNLHHLQHLDLSYNYFKGSSIPPQLGNLKNLTFLSLSNAGFEGEIPMELGNITTLRHLDLSAYYSARLSSSRFADWVKHLRSLEYLAMKDVEISKASEHQWGNALNSLSNLKEIYLSGCGLSGRIPSLLNLTHLSHLHFPRNSFPLQLPSWFENVSSLVSLDLSDCNLGGFIPSNFLHRSNLSNVELSYNPNLKGNLSFIISHSSSLSVLSLQGWSPDEGGVEGVIPPSIANFSKLEKLNLACNNLTGDLPQFGYTQGTLFHLSEIDLSYNHLNGRIPSSLGSLSSLRYLDLSHNQLEGTIPDTIPKLVQLERLSLSSNNLTLKESVFVSLVENLTRLEMLSLSANPLRLNISSSWVPQFAHLKDLVLRSCNIHGDFPAFISTQYSLKKLDLSDNSITGNIPTWLWDLPSLEALNLSNNRLEGEVQHVRSDSLAIVDLHGNGLQGSVPVFNYPSSILFVDLSENHFNGPIPSAAIGDRTFYISLSGNKLSGGIPDSVCAKNNYSLEVLDLSNNSLTGTIPPNMGRCSSLKILNLNRNRLQGEIPQEMGNLTSLRTLNLNVNNLQGAIPWSLANCKDLRILDIGNNKIEGDIPVWIEKLTQLQIFSLTANKIQSRIPPHLFTMKNLQILDLSDNNLSGKIPENLEKLKAMVNHSSTNEIGLDGIGILSVWVHGELLFVDEVTLWIKGRSTTYMKIFGGFKFMDLSHNQLSGNIPHQMGLLRGLISLNISRNNLNGSIPESLGAMTQMESLDLSSNKLSGEIPLQLLNLTFLSILNLSNNMLSGVIPRGRQFSTFEASSFAGNPDLHGFPLENGTVNNRSEEGNNNKKREIESGIETENMDEWWVVAVGLCYGMGFGLVIALAWFDKEWRDKYFALLDSLVVHLFQG